MQPEADKKLISNAQLETVAYSLQRFYGPLIDSGARGGFFLGDGAGAQVTMPSCNSIIHLGLVLQAWHCCALSVAVCQALA